MWPGEDEGGTVAPPGKWRVSDDVMPWLIGGVCAGALVLALLACAIVWRCCILPRRHKSYCTRMAEELNRRHRNQMPPAFHSQCAVFASARKGHWAYNSRLVSPPGPGPLAPGTHWFYNNRVLSPANLERVDPGQSHQIAAESDEYINYCRCSFETGALSRSLSYAHERGPAVSPTNRNCRPLSQPMRFASSSDLAVHGRHLPEISEFAVHPAPFASTSISFILTVLDDVGDGSELAPAPVRTRSLPAWVRSRPRPLSADDNLTDLYAKVNFSKKRKNRMRNDEAAIIALSKSRSQFLHKDTDSLVDNEAVIVYNERTAL